ncbi:MAG: hypothetical protein HYT65_01835 [Candidatus Yanofskybacteria bacterium]|nr:hypothetical protein [Candidatus Yanofskybacteria bacterium]
MNKQKLIRLVVLAVGIGLIWFFSFSKKVAQEPVDFAGEIILTPTATSEPSPVISPMTLPSRTPEITSKYPPAECSLTGSITYISPGLYENKDANIIYKNIDSVARLVLWTIFPDDNLSVGPNIFASLPLPDGIEDVTVSLPDNPKSKNYTLTAKVTYGVVIDRNLVIKESLCAGQIPIEIAY